MSRTAWAAPLAWSAAILIATSIPGDQLPPAFPYADKFVHLGIYGVLGVLVGRACRLDRRPSRTGAVGVVRWVCAIALFAAFDEWHQDFIPGRASDSTDWLMDVVGATAGLAIATTTLRPEQRI